MKGTTGESDTNRRQQALVTAMAVTAIVAIVTVVVGPWRGGGDVTETEGPGSPGLLVPRPPEVDSSRPHLVVSPPVIPAAGADVALILANPGPDPLSFGPLGRLQRWDGSTWSDHRQVSTSLGPEQPAGKLHGPEEELMVPAIALTAQPGGFGPPVWSHIDGLTPGWYRFQLGNAIGILEVGGTPHPGPTRPTTPIAFSGTSVVAADAPAVLSLDAQPRRPWSGAFEPEQDLGSYTSEARVERLDGERWVVVPSDTVHTSPGESGPFTVELPALEAGAYRVSRQASVAGRVESLLWVVRPS